MTDHRTVIGDNEDDAATIASPRDILQQAGERFVRNRREDRVKAYAELQQALMSNMGILVPQVVSLPDLLKSNRDLEEFIKVDSGSKHTDPAEALEHFLNGTEHSDPDTPPVPPIEVLQ